MSRKLAAWLNLALHFARHVLFVLPARALGRGGNASRFLGAVVPEGYVPLMPAEREMMPRAMGCIHCGLCSLACPALREAPRSAWDEPWTFVAGPSRALDRAALVAAAAPCSRCDACAAACPTGVPIPELAAMLGRMAKVRSPADVIPD